MQKMVVSQNVVKVRSSSHGIKLRRSELWTQLSVSCRSSKETGVWFSSIERR